MGALNNAIMVRPFLKWAGGKRQLLHVIKALLPPQIENYNYVEPFIGAGALLFELKPQKAIINDSNSQLITTYKAIKNDIDELIELLNIHQNNNCKEYYYEIRSQDRNSSVFNKLSDVEKAARLIFMNKTCYNGLYRVNSKGLFNVPYGKYKNPKICEENVLRSVHRYFSLNCVEIMNADFSCITKSISSNSFVYFDPPYHSPSNTNFTGYQADGFSEKDQLRLRDDYIQLAERGVKCLLSNADTPFIREIYANKKFEIFTISAKRCINSDASLRGDVNEVIIKNWV
ncbi:DNA adenine methylase [Desulfovibrio sp. 86]|uniref:site-specific DNA-methyltransferase (adenine-specific) n=1 Tax=uncultured Desulfovibrio sp. TaxID=167968 RepID=A0A212L4J4_9BACT|nr:DNA adenine methylase [Desulfovibrio sp. 86]SCM72436.1 Modification methylase LlaDCHIA [uncultured Desulfovibrio sp.]VZH33515.1 Modification methylase LlaDCHIA [Desulfovibrio sp. 86]